MRSRGKAYQLKVWPGVPVRNWPWIPVCDKRMLPLKTDRHVRDSRRRVSPPMAVVMIRVRIRHWRTTQIANVQRKK